MIGTRQTSKAPREPLAERRDTDVAGSGNITKISLINDYCPHRFALRSREAFQQRGESPRARRIDTRRQRVVVIVRDIPIADPKPVPCTPLCKASTLSVNDFVFRNGQEPGPHRHHVCWNANRAGQNSGEHLGGDVSGKLTVPAQSKRVPYDRPDMPVVERDDEHGVLGHASQQHRLDERGRRGHLVRSRTNDPKVDIACRTRPGSVDVDAAKAPGRAPRVPTSADRSDQRQKSSLGGALLRNVERCSAAVGGGQQDAACGDTAQ